MSVEAAMNGLTDPVLTEAERVQIILGVERMRGGLAALQALAAALQERRANLEARARMKIGKQDELLVRLAELETILEGVAKRIALTNNAGLAITRRHPDIFAGEQQQTDAHPPVESATVSEAPAPAESSAPIPA